METEAQLIVQRASLRLPRTTASQLDTPRPGYRPGQISRLGQEMARVAYVKPRLVM